MDKNKEYDVLKEISIIANEINIVAGLSRLLEKLINNNNSNLLETDIYTLCLVNRRACSALLDRMQELEGQLQI